MPDTIPAAQIRVSKTVYLAIRVTPLIAAYILSTMKTPIVISALITFILSFIDLFLTKEYFGPGLVGLRYYRNQSEVPRFPNIVYFSKPLPFVASSADSNVFWVGLLFSTVGWTILCFIYILFSRFMWFLISFLITVVNIMNFSAFMKCHNVGKEQADSIARNLLLDKNVSFQAAKEENELSSDSDGNEEEETPTTVLEA